MEELDLCLFRGQRPVSACCYHFEINRCLCCAVTLSRACAASSVSPESNPFHRSHKVPLTLKIHSSGFILWSEVARAPKTNRGLRSGIRDGQVPGTHHAGLILWATLYVIIQDMNLTSGWQHFLHRTAYPKELFFLNKINTGCQHTLISAFLTLSIM